MNPDDLPLITVWCCRPWLVCPLFPVGRCGYCGHQPAPLYGP